jgi:hypothetical protein
MLTNYRFASRVCPRVSLRVCIVVLLLVSGNRDKGSNVCYVFREYFLTGLQLILKGLA